MLYLSSSRPEIYSFDHVFPSASLEAGNTSSLPVVILYCQWGTEVCRDWHSQLATIAAKDTARYVFRHHFQVWHTTYSIYMFNNVESLMQYVCVQCSSVCSVIKRLPVAV